MKKAWDRLQSNWNAAVAAGAWLLAIATAAILPPPVGANQFGGDGSTVKFVGMLVPLIVGLLTVPLLRRSKKSDARFWWRAALACVIGAAACFFAYNWFTTDWTAEYAGERVVIGSTFTANGEAYVRANPQRIAPSDWVMAHAGAVEEIWTKRSIDIRCALLAALYIVSVNIFVCAIVSAMQSVYCASRKK